MATERPRLQAYLDSALHERFTQWKQERGIPKDSEALNQLLAEYFGVSCDSDSVPNPQPPTTDELRILIQEELWDSGKRDFLEGIKLEAQAMISKQVAEAKGFWEEMNSMNLIQDFRAGFEVKLDDLTSRLEGLLARFNNLELAFAMHSLSESPDELPSELPGELSGELSVPASESPDELPSELPGELSVPASESPDELPDELPSEPPSDYISREAPFYEGDIFERWGEKLRVERVGKETLYCHLANGSREENTAYIRVPFAEAESIKNQSLDASGELPSELPSKLPESLIQRALAQRFGINAGTVQKKREKLSPEDFAAWSKSKDPDAIAWQYDPEKKVYVSL